MGTWTGLRVGLNSKGLNSKGLNSKGDWLWLKNSKLLVWGHARRYREDQSELAVWCLKDA